VVVKLLFSVFKGAEKCLHPIPGQLPAQTPPAFGEVCMVPQKPAAGARPSLTPASRAHAAVTKASLALSISAPLHHLLVPQRPPSRSANQFSKLGGLKINPTKRRGGKKRRGGLYRDQSAPAPLALQPKEHKCRERGENGLLAGAQL